MKLEEMKRIAEARTKGKWRPESGLFEDIGYAAIGPMHEGENPDFTVMKDAQFIAMAANNWDKLIAVVEAAKKYRQEDTGVEDLCGLDDALKALEEP